MYKRKIQQLKKKCEALQDGRSFEVSSQFTITDEDQPSFKEELESCKSQIERITAENAALVASIAKEKADLRSTESELEKAQSLIEKLVAQVNDEKVAKFSLNAELELAQD